MFWKCGDAVYGVSPEVSGGEGIVDLREVGMPGDIVKKADPEIGQFFFLLRIGEPVEL